MEMTAEEQLARIEETEERGELVRSTRRFLEKYEAGEHADVDYEMVRLARVIDEHSGRCRGGFLDQEMLGLYRECGKLRRRQYDLSDEEAEAKAQKVWTKIREVQDAADATVDDAADQLAQLAEKR